MPSHVDEGVVAIVRATGVPHWLRSAGIAAVAVALGVASLIAIPEASAQAETDRLAGQDRFATAAAISQRAFPDGADRVFLARSDVFADALAAGPLSSGPVLLVPSCGAVPEVVQEEIARLDPQRVTALGGGAAVCDEVLVAAADGRPYDRLRGDDRFETAVAISQEEFPGEAVEVYLASSRDSPDAVAGGVLTRGPILLVPPDGPVPGVVAAEIERLHPERVVALGGEVAVSAAVLTEAADGRPTRRLAGANRFETAAAIAAYQFGADSEVGATASTVYLARGDVFADAVAGGALGDGPILLVPSCGDLPEAPRTEIWRLDPAEVIALGGPSAVCDDVLEQAVSPVVAGFDAVAPAPGGPVTIMSVIAAGPDRLVSMSNVVITITDKRGQVIDTRASTDFFDPALPHHDLAHITDPHVVYDPHSARFFVVEAAMDVYGDRYCEPEAICSEYQLLAVSKDATPRSLGPDDWHIYALDRTIRRTDQGVLDAEGLGDQDILGVSEDAVVIRHVDYDLEDGSPQAVNLRIIAKADLLDGSAPTEWRDITGLTEPMSGEGEFHMHPVADDDGGFYLVNTFTWADCLDVIVWRLDDPLGDTSLEYTIVEGADPPEGCSGVRQQARQRDGPDIWTGRATTSASLVGDSLWTAALVTVDHSDGDAMGVGWIEIDVSSWPPQLAQGGALSDPSVDRYEPVLAADPHGNVGILYGQSSPDHYPALYAAYRLADDPAGELRESVRLLQANHPHDWVTGFVGEHSHHGYMGSAPDPEDGSVWFIGEYPLGDHRWGAWGANLRFR